MTRDFKPKIDGLDELLKDFRTLPGKIRGKYAARAAKEAIEPIYSETVRRAPVYTGELAESIKISRSRRGGLVSAKVKVSAPHAHLVEFGHNIRSKKGGESFGFVKEHPFIRPAFDNNLQNAIDTYDRVLTDGLKEHFEKE